MPGLLLIPALLCADCGHVPVPEAYPANHNRHITKTQKVRCLNNTCPQFYRLIEVGLGPVGCVVHSQAKSVT